MQRTIKVKTSHWLPLTSGTAPKVRWHVGLILIFVCLPFIAVAQDTIPPVIPDTLHQVSPAVSTADTLPDAVIQAEEIIGVPEESPVHSPMRATMLSVALPGMGQIYNGKIWKVPFIYAGFGTIAWFVDFNNGQYQHFRKNWVARIDGNPNTVDEYPNIPAERLQRIMNAYRRQLEITYILGAALYVLNVLDATVDAHLLDFDVGEDLSLKIRPSLLPANQTFGNTLMPTAGVRLSFTF